MTAVMLVLWLLVGIVALAILTVGTICILGVLQLVRAVAAEDERRTHLTD